MPLPPLQPPLHQLPPFSSSLCQVVPERMLFGFVKPLMEIDQSFLGFEEPTSTDVDSSCSGGGYKLVPWLSWDEWDSVRDRLFSSSPPLISSALRRISTWRSRGCLPVVIEVTASIVEIRLKDPFFREDLDHDALDSEEMLSMLYCMAIVSSGCELHKNDSYFSESRSITLEKQNGNPCMRIPLTWGLEKDLHYLTPFLWSARLVNGVVEKTRKKTEVSIGEAADWLNIPRMLIDIRHEGSHRDLPSLRLVRFASVKALDWLKSYYWEPQKKAISSHRDGIASLRKEIKSRLYELAIGLKIKQATRSNSSLAKEKRIKHCECLWGRNKFSSLMAAKQRSSKSAGSMRQITKALKHLVRLYSSYSSEVVSVLVQLLLKASDSSDFAELPKDDQVSHSADHVQSVFGDWKPVITKLSNKEPELLLTLTKGALEMIEAQEAMRNISGNAASVNQIERLSDLVECLVTTLKGLKMPRKVSSSLTEGSSTDKSLPMVTLQQLLRKSLLVSSHSNTQLRNSALILTRMIGNSALVQKVSKLCSLGASNPTISEENSSIVSSKSILVPQEADSLCEAAAKLEFVKNRRRMKSRVLKMREGVSGTSNRWIMTKSWNSCPIGMLPCDVGSSGRLPILDCDDDHKEVPKPLRSEEHKALNKDTRKRGPDCDVEILENSKFKKMREHGEAYGLNGGDGDNNMSDSVKGRLMIGGVWKKVREEELRAIASSVRILV